MGRRRWLPAVLLAAIMAGCSSSGGEPGGEPGGAAASAPAVEPGTTVTIELAERPFRLHVPEGYDAAAGAPLVVLLHGYTSSAAEQEVYFGLGSESDRRGFLYAMPDGTLDTQGEQFWSATTACCDLYGSGVDDAGYLRRLIDTVFSSYAVDRSGVYVVGHSNGGFMAYRMACDHADVITAVVSLAGAVTADESQCAPARPVSVLQIHGTADEVISYEGGEISGNPYPSVDTTVGMWRRLNGCTDEPADPASPLDLEDRVDGAETTVTTYATGCRDGSVVELWSIENGQHVPRLTDEFAPAVLDFLYARSSPAG